MLVVKMYTGSAPPLSEIYPSLYPDPDDPVLGAASAFAAPPPLASAAALAAAVNGTLANGTSGSPLYYGAPGSMQALPPPISLGALSASASAAGGLPPPDDNSKLLTEVRAPLSRAAQHAANAPRMLRVCASLMWLWRALALAIFIRLGSTSLRSLRCSPSAQCTSASARASASSTNS